MLISTGIGHLMQGHRLRCSLKLVPDSDILTGFDAHIHISVVLKCILHALNNLGISNSLSLRYIEHFHKFGLIRAMGF